MDHQKNDVHSNDRQFASLVSAIVDGRNRLLANRALLVGVSGIDASGKGFVSAGLADALRASSIKVALISADDWLNLPQVCISPDNSPAHFYKHALRLTEMFERLVLPLRDRRRADLLADCGDAKATIHRKHHYLFRNIDIILLEGIFLFKPTYCDHFDLKIWIDCSCETALQRAIQRGQEGLPPSETRKAFEAIYFPAQRIHAERDRPRETADLVFFNDSQQSRSPLKRPPCPERVAR